MFWEFQVSVQKIVVSYMELENTLNRWTELSRDPSGPNSPGSKPVENFCKFQVRDVSQKIQSEEGK
jgi:hypothetical protein